MKTNSLLVLLSLAALTTTVSAASNQTDSSVLALPAYVVTAPRDQSAEQQIKNSLEELRRQSLTPMAIVPELNLLNGRTAPVLKVAHTDRAPVAVGGVKS